MSDSTPQWPRQQRDGDQSGEDAGLGGDNGEGRGLLTLEFGIRLRLGPQPGRLKLGLHSLQPTRQAIKCYMECKFNLPRRANASMVPGQECRHKIRLRSGMHMHTSGMLTRSAGVSANGAGYDMAGAGKLHFMQMSVKGGTGQSAQSTLEVLTVCKR